MVNLRRDLTAIEMNRVGQLFHFRDMVIPGDTQVVDGRNAVHVVHTGIFIDNHADTAFGPLLIVADLSGGNDAVLVGQIRGHGHHDAAVFQNQGSDTSFFK